MSSIYPRHILYRINPSLTVYSKIFIEEYRKILSQIAVGLSSAVSRVMKVQICAWEEFCFVSINDTTIQMSDPYYLRWYTYETIIGSVPYCEGCGQYKVHLWCIGWYCLITAGGCIYCAYQNTFFRSLYHSIQ